MLFAFWIASLPLIMFGGYYEVPKVFWLISGGVVLVIYWFIKLLKSPNDLKIIKADKFYLIWLFIIFTSSLWESNPQLSILGGSYRHQGLIFFFTLWLVSKTVGILNKSQKLILYKLVAITIIIESLIVLIGYKLGTIGEVNAVAGFLAMGIYFVFISKLPKWLLIFPFIGGLMELSRSALLSVIGYLNIRSKNHLRIFFCIAITFLALFFVKYNFQKNTVEDRFVIWKFSFQEILKKPILGYGLESGEEVFNVAYKNAEIPLEEIIIDRSHNLFLDILMWSGVIGLIPFLLFLKNVKKSKLFWVFLIYSMFQPLSVVHWTLFFLVI